MARTNSNLERRAAKKTSYREIDDEDEVETPDTISQRVGRSDRLEEELKEVKQQLRSETSNGQGFLKNITHIHTPRQWRGEM
jgi:hypothetical protein